MSDYIKREDAIKAVIADAKLKNLLTGNCEDEKAIEGMVYGVLCPRDVPSADVVEADKAQKEIDYWHDKAQSYEQTILKLALNKADVVEVVRCKDCKHGGDAVTGNYKHKLNLIDCNRIISEHPYIMRPNDFCSYGERAEA